MIAFACLLGLVLAPQEPTAKPARGRVLDPDGHPVAAADVVCLYRPLWNCLEAPGEHRLRVRTDDKGMFRAPLREGCTYSVWASSSAMATACEEGVTAGDFVALRPDPSAQPVRVRVKGSEAWTAAGPLTWRALVGSENVDLVPVPVVDGVLAVPPLPATAFRVFEMLDRNGEVLWADAASREGDQLVLSIPPPFEVQLAVHDDQGKPLAGVTIHHHIRNYWFTASPIVQGMDRFRCLWPVCGVTDANGSLRVRVCVEGHDADHPVQSLHLMARKPGYRASLSGIQDGKSYHDGRIGEAAGIQFTLAKAEPGVVKLQDSPWAPAPGSLTWFTWRVQVHTADGTGSSGLPFQELGRVGAGGVPLDIAPPASDELETAWTMLRDASRATAAAAGGVAMPLLCRVDIAGTPAGGYQLRFPDDAQRRIQVAESDGRPAERAVAMVTPLVDGGPDLEHVRMVRTDRLGRAWIGVQSGGVRVAVVTRNGAGAGIMKCDDKEPWRLQLGALATVQARVVDEDGKPVAGVGIRISRFDAELKSNDDAIAPQEVSYLCEALPAMKSDAAGRFTLVYVRCAGSLVFAAADPSGRWQLKEQAPFPCAGDETELVLSVVSTGR